MKLSTAKKLKTGDKVVVRKSLFLKKCWKEWAKEDGLKKGQILEFKEMFLTGAFDFKGLYYTYKCKHFKRYSPKKYTWKKAQELAAKTGCIWLECNWYRNIPPKYKVSYKRTIDTFETLKDLIEYMEGLVNEQK